jgi:hypothetical protein
MSEDEKTSPDRNSPIELIARLAQRLGIDPKDEAIVDKLKARVALLRTERPLRGPRR